MMLLDNKQFMSKFKVGDRVRWQTDIEGYYLLSVNGGILFEHIDKSKNLGWDREQVVPSDYISKGCDTYWTVSEDELTKLTLVSNAPFTIDTIDTFVQVVAENYKNYKNNKTIMSNLITTFKNITRSEPNKTFVKAGVMNEDLSLTSEGKELFIQFMFDKHATEFKTEVVDAILAEQEKK